MTDFMILLLVLGAPFFLAIGCWAMIRRDSTEAKRISLLPLTLAPQHKLSLLKLVYSYAFSPLQVCQRALVESDYDHTEAVKLLKETKLDQAYDRTMLVSQLIDDIGAAVEFTSRYEITLQSRDLKHLAKGICFQIIQGNPKSVDQLLEMLVENVSIKQALYDIGSTTSDTVEIKSFVRIDYSNVEDRSGF